MKRGNKIIRSKKDKLPRKYLPHKHGYHKYNDSMNYIQSQISQLKKSIKNIDPFVLHCPICNKKMNSTKFNSHLKTHSKN